MQSCNHSSLKDFSVFIVYAVTAAVKISQSRLYSISLQLYSHYSHTVIIVIQSLQPYSQSYSHSSLKDFSAFTAYAVTAAVKISQSRLYSISLQPYSHCSHAANHTVSYAVSHAATLALKISQSSQPTQSL